MMKLANHPEFELRDDAAASFDRVEALHGAFTVTSAKRSVEDQQKLIDRWNAGGVYNRPPYLYHPAYPPGTSAHVKNGGIAVDVVEHERFADVAALHGFYRSFEWDIVHFEYHPQYDKFINPEVEEAMTEIERLSKVLGGTLERAENGESISQRLDTVIDLNRQILSAVDRLSTVLGGTVKRPDTISIRVDKILDQTK